MTPSLVTLLFAVLCPALNHALALPILSPQTGRMGGALTPSSSLLRRGSTKFGRCSLIMRGGGESDDSESDGNEYDVISSSDEELTDKEDLVNEELTDSDEEEDLVNDTDSSDDEDEKTKEIALMYKKAALSSQSRNYAIATALWSSLFFDSIINKVKRADLFPALIQGAEVVIPAATLASGFFISSGVAFLLWRDLEIRSETLGGDESKKGDWFLSLSTTNDEDAESEKFATETRQRLLIHLSLFGILNLGAHAGLLFTDQAPFLGVSAAIINVHNTLACLSALVKEKSVPELITQAVSWPISLFKSGGREESAAKKEGVISYLFRLSAVAAWMRCIPVCKSLFALAMGATVPDTINIVDKARELSLTVASLARLTLTAGVAKTLYASSASSTDSIRNHPFFATLSGMMSMVCFGLGGTMLYSSLILNISLSKAILGEAALLVVFGLVSGYNSVASFIASKGTA
uniref:Uncharacterized protein n=1 Tax=Skeletonema marinoi TaxID=267567 RepID=A0A7S2Q259_9STRA|mmetsp:Transcript_8204/g.13856  ORF Transcript_8204/g.13856 Transcript_8204/m.13856 type:complete len:465 (+) Transcript_8204:63-1457(+)